jgi:hypothetical protein
MVFRLVLAKIGKYGYAERMTKKPRCYEDPIRFHQTYWVKFTKQAQPPWGEMLGSEKRDHLWRFLKTKFSLDPAPIIQRRVPGSPKKRKS